MPTFSSFLILSVIFTSHQLFAAYPEAIKDDAIHFKYIEIEGSAEGDCSHKAVTTYDWQVTCEVKKNTFVYNVHLALTYYPATNEGYPAYEFLYWVSEQNPVTVVGDSISQWLYLNPNKSLSQNAIPKWQTRLGIKNDSAYLQLVLNLKN